MDDANAADDMVLDFDPDALREKYQQERDRRIRAEGNSQYVEVDLLIIGGGFGGLLVGARAREAGDLEGLELG